MIKNIISKKKFSGGLCPVKYGEIIMMLTIQPKITTGALKQSYRPAFKSHEEIGEFADEKYNDAKDFVRETKESIDEVMDDVNVPNSVKKVFKVLGTVATVVLDGVAVFWATTKGAKILKSAHGKIMNNEAVKSAINLLTPIKNGAKRTQRIAKIGIYKQMKKLKANERYQKFMAPINKFFTENKYGKKIAAIYNYVKEGTSALIKKFKEKVGKVTYEKATNATAATLGTGSGVAGAYQAVKNDNQDSFDYEGDE